MWLLASGQSFQHAQSGLYAVKTLRAALADHDADRRLDLVGDHHSASRDIVTASATLRFRSESQDVAGQGSPSFWTLFELTGRPAGSAAALIDQLASEVTSRTVAGQGIRARRSRSSATRSSATASRCGHSASWSNIFANAIKTSKH